MQPPEETLKSLRGQDCKIKQLLTAIHTMKTFFQPLDMKPCFRFWALSRGSRALKTPAKAGSVTQLAKCLLCRPKDSSLIPEGDPSARETEIDLAQGYSWLTTPASLVSSRPVRDFVSKDVKPFKGRD